MFKAHGLVYHSTLGLRVIKKKSLAAHVHLSLAENVGALLHVILLLVQFLDEAALRVQSLGFRVWDLRGGLSAALMATADLNTSKGRR